jgi:hypothetical protein
MTTIRQRLQFTEADLQSPILFHPDTWTWENLELGESITLIAPEWFADKAIKASQDADAVQIDHAISHKPREDDLKMVLFTCAGRKRGTTEKMNETIPASESPSGSELTLTLSIRFGRKDMMSKGRRRWPFREMRPGEAIEVYGPKEIVNQSTLSACAYVHPSCDRKIRATRQPVDSDGFRKAIIWCEEV